MQADSAKPYSVVLEIDGGHDVTRFATEAEAVEFAQLANESGPVEVTVRLHMWTTTADATEEDFGVRPGIDYPASFGGNGRRAA